MKYPQKTRGQGLGTHEPSHGGAWVRKGPRTLAEKRRRFGTPCDTPVSPASASAFVRGGQPVLPPLPATPRRFARRGSAGGHLASPRTRRPPLSCPSSAGRTNRLVDAIFTATAIPGTRDDTRTANRKRLWRRNAAKLAFIGESPTQS